MSIYPSGSVVAANYADDQMGNPFAEAMPDVLSPNYFIKHIASLPAMPHDLQAFSLEERRRHLSLLSSLFLPLPYMYTIYDSLYRAIATTYTTRMALDEIRQINALFGGRAEMNYAVQADSGSILGVPGIGKSSTVHRCLSIMPQVIEHTEYRGQPFYCKQILYLQVECPSDCSIKTLAFNILLALDKVIGSRYLDNLTSLRSSSASAIATQIKILCMTHHVGLLLIDEIQNAVVTANRNHQVRPLIKFLVELTNDTCTAIYFIGTPLAEELFICQEHLKRRTRGVRLLPLKPDWTYRTFLEKLWQYQFTPQITPLTDKLANKLYDWSGGIPAYIVKIFQETQAQSLLMGSGCISESIMQRAIDILSIKVPRTYSGGTYISDFELGEPSPEPVSGSENGPKLYANKRGRKAAVRDKADLLVAYRTGQDVLSHLTAHGLLEEREPPC